MARLLQERGFAVQTVMTDAAQKFVQPLTFAALTGRKVVTGLFTEDILSSAIEHKYVDHGEGRRLFRKDG